MNRPAFLVATVWLSALVAHAAETAVLPPRLAQPLVIQYPDAARRSNLEGRVVVRLKVRSDGLPELVRIYSSSGSKLLDDEALRAVSQARFIPGRVDERPTEMRLNLPLNFSAKNSTASPRTAEPTVELRSRSPDAKGDPTPIVISLTAQGQPYLEQRPVALESLEDELALRFSRTPSASVHLRADRNVTYQRVVDVLTAVNNAGAVSIKFIVEPQ